MENILAKLLAAETVKEGTQELREAFKNPEAVSALCIVLVTSPNPQIRQYAAVLLRRRLTKARNWSRIPVEARNSIKQGLIEALIKEPEKFVKNSIAQLIGAITRHEFPNQSWPELLQCLQMWTNSENANDKELGFYTLSVLSEVASDQFLVHAQLFGFLFNSTLRSLTDLSCPIAYLTLVCMTNFVPSVDGDQTMVNLYHEAMPRVLEVIKELSKKRPDRAVQAMELLEEVLENATTVLVPHLKLSIALSLDLAVDRSVGMDLQKKALSFLGDVVRIKKKAVVKHDLIQPILSVLFRLMSMPPEDEDEEKYFADDDESTPTTCANTILDTMALHLPPEKIIPPLLQYIQPGLEGTDLYTRKAAYLSMAMLSEGCSDYIRTKHLEQFLRYVCKGITEQASVVRNAALFALGQFSEYLQPEISTYAQELLPVLFEFLSRLQGVGDSEPPQGGVDRMFYALEMFCENLGDALLPYLPTLMERLLPLLIPPHSVRVRELAISAVGAAANAAKESMLPYFSKIMVYLKQYLVDEQDDDTMCLQVQAVDTLGVLARTIGEENFLPMARESIELGLNLMSKTDDPDLRKSCYGLFSSVSTVMKENMVEVLGQILVPMLAAVSSSDGVVFHYKEDENNAFPVYEDLSDTADEEDIDHESDVSEDEDVAYTVENAYVEEKEEACLALREIAENTGIAFLPYLQKSFEEVSKLLTYPQDDIRKAAVEAVTQFIINFSKIETEEGVQVLQKTLEDLIPKCAEMVRMDGDRDVVMTALNSFTELLKDVGPRTLAVKGHTVLILNSVIDIMNHRTECQDKGEDDEPEAEQDEVLVETAGEVIPHFGKALGPDEFSQHYAQLLPLFLALTKPKCSDAQRSFGVGMIAECMEPLGEKVSIFLSQLFPFLISLTHDKNDDVRNNSIFALGEMALHGKSAVFGLYPQLLQALSTAVSTERHTTTLDNICGAIARLIVTNISGIPLEEVLPVFIHYLPLREDFEENKWVFKSIELMYQLGTEPLRKQILPIIKIAVTVIHKEQIEKDNMEMVVNLVKMCYKDFPTECATAASELPSEISVTLQQICSS